MQMVRLLLSLLLLPALVAHAGDTGRVPQTARELWAGLDPAAEPLDVQVVKEWEDGDAGLRYLLYTVGTLKGRKPRMAAYYAFPRGGRSLPAILHLHGGGQRASSDTVRYWTKLGYAAMSINWGGKPVEGDDAPNTDWAGLAAGFREPRHHNDVSPGQDTLHDVPHPANSSWHLCALAARRALTFLQQQPEVDGGRLGLTGHSMGGRLTVLTAIDPRVKAAVPSVGGSGFLYDDLWGIPGSSRHMREHLGLYNRTVDCRSYWPLIRCPVLFLGATNDFNSPTELVVQGLSRLQHDRWRLVLAPHLNHRFTTTTYAARPLWFEAHLKGTLAFPKTPAAELALKTDDGVPALEVEPDGATPHRIVGVDVYYGYARDPRNRFWRDAQAARVGGRWEGRCPVMALDEPLFAFANVTYDTGRAIPMPPGYDRQTSRLTVTSQYCAAYPKDLRAAGVRATEKPRRLIDDFARGWHDWYRLSAGNRHHWYFATRKIADPAWVGPRGAQLCFEIRTAEAGNHLGVVADTNTWRGYTGRKRNRYVAVVPLPRAGWPRVALAAGQLKDAKGRPLDDWHEITELAFTPADKATDDDKAHPPWKGDPPQLRDLRWVGGTHVPRPKPYLRASQQRLGKAAEGPTRKFRRAVEGSVRREREPD